MTMHIDEALLERVMDIYGLETKTDAVHFALNELDRKARLRAMLNEGMGLSADELRAGVDPNYDPMRMRVADDITPYGSERPH